MKQTIKASVKTFAISSVFSLFLVSCHVNDTNDETAAATVDHTTTVDNTHTDMVADTSVNMPPPVAEANQPATPNPAKKGLKGKLSASVEMPAPPPANAKMVADQNGLYPIVDIMASFPNGTKGLQDFINKNIEYPVEANNAGVEGSVRVTFIVDENGKIIDPKVVGNKPGYGLEEEALAIVKRMPAWYPAQVKDKKVKTRITLPIRFELN